MTDWTQERFLRLVTEYAVPDEEIDDKKELKARRILRAATDLFVRLGYRKTSVDDVARAAGVGKGTVYLYFETKADLLIHCVMLEKAAPAARLFTLFASMTDPVAIFRLSLRMSFELIHDMPLVNRLIRGDHELTLVFDELGFEFKELIGAAQVGHYVQVLRPVATCDDATLQRTVASLISVLRASPNIVAELDELHLDRIQHAHTTADLLATGVLSAIGAPLQPAEPSPSEAGSPEGAATTSTGEVA